MDVDDFIREYPEIWHMAERGSWPKILRDGLLSTAALLDLYQVQAEERRRLESCRRASSETIAHATTSEKAVLRDNRPITEALLCKRLTGGMKPADWYRLLNRHVFFWVERKDLQGFLRTYGDAEQDVITVDTGELVERDVDQIAITPFNTGSMRRPSEYERGPETFARIRDFDLQYWRARIRHRRPIVELAVEYKLVNVGDVAVCVERWYRDELRETVWVRNSAGT